MEKWKSYESSNDFDVFNSIIGTEINGVWFEDVMEKSLTFDFNNQCDNGYSFEQCFMERTTNELRNLISPYATEVIILQFRKFMAVNAFSIMMKNRREDILENDSANYSILKWYQIKIKQQ